MGPVSAALRIAARATSPEGRRARLPILIYHRVLAAPDPVLADGVDARTFDAQMKALAECFTVLPLADAADRLARDALPARAACVTFDDGYRDNVAVALPILRRHGVHATFFIASGYLDGGRMFNDTVIEAVRRIPGATLALPELGLPALTLGTAADRTRAIDRVLAKVKYLAPAERAAAVERIAALAPGGLPDDLMMESRQVRELAAAGMGIGSHTVSHPILASVPDEVAAREIAENRACLESLTSSKVSVFAYPNGVPGRDYGAAHVAMVRRMGFAAAVSASPGAARAGSDLHQLPRFTPWDRHPMRFVARLLHNAVINEPRAVPGGG